MKENNFCKNCTIVELFNTGHRVNLYLDLNVKAAIQAGFNVEIYTSESAYVSEEFKVFRTNHPNIKITALPSPWLNESIPTRNIFRLLICQSMRVIEIKKTLNFNKKSRIVFNTFDDFVFGFWLFPKNDNFFLKTIFVSPKMRSIQGIRIKKIKNILMTVLFYFACKRFNTKNGILIIDELFDSYINSSKILRNTRSQVFLINDVGESSGKDRQIDRHKDKNKLSILVYGSLTLRKGIKPLLLSVAQEKFNFDIEIILAGNPNAEVLEFLDGYKAEHNVAITTHLSFISHELESRLFNECDIVWLGYLKKFISSSGVLYQAWSAEKPVIACNHGLIGSRVKNQNGGITVDVDNLVQIKNAISLLGKKDNEYEKLKLNAKLAGQNYTKAAFIKSLTNTIYA